MVALWLSGTSFRTITITMPLRQMSARQTSCHSELVWVADEDVTRDQKGMSRRLLKLGVGSATLSAK